MYLTKRLFYTIFLITFVLLVSCNKDDDDDPQPAIVGTWRLTDVEFTFNDQSIRDFLEQYYSDQNIEITDEELDQLEAAFNEGFEGEFDDGTTFEFQSNGTLVVDSPDDAEDSQSTWQLTNNNTLIINDGTEAAEFTVETLTNSELKISFEDEQDLGLDNTENVTIGLTLSFAKQ